MRDGFDDFVRGRSTGLLRVAYLLTGDRHTAEDLVQEVLEQMYVRWRRIQGAPEAYARRALVNRATNRWRSRGRRPEAPLGRHDVAEPDHSEHVVIRDAVVEALRALPPRQRAAVVLRYLDDLPIADVARALDCSEGSVKSNASRGLERLRAALAPVAATTTTERGPR
ncbi:SigE family RNA polymerase sigma factor [Actinoplanes sp. NPDC049668]|uniref:SigE family RNA polymerase sigma factor n=1 Tax=unclassified Actinoplanes TaxID=2626549 RepID=UPI0033A185B0